MSKKRNSNAEWVDIIRRGDAALASGIPLKKFCYENGINLTTYYGAKHRYQVPAVRTNGVANGNGDLKHALDVLRQHGIRIPKQVTDAARVEAPKLKRRDLKKLRHWCDWSFTHQERFVVGWGGGVRNAHIVCHSTQGLEARQKHATEIQKMVGH